MNFQVIYPKELEDYVKRENAFVIDIRDKEDYEKGHWKNARNYPYDLVEKWEKTLPTNRLIILYCEHGGSSMQLARRLGMEGYRVASVVGGYKAMTL